MTKTHTGLNSRSTGSRTDPSASNTDARECLTKEHSKDAEVFPYLVTGKRVKVPTPEICNSDFERQLVAF